MMKSTGEFELIAKYFAWPKNPIAHYHGNEQAGVDIGIGDDAALLIPSKQSRLAVTTDTLVEDVHFPRQCNPELLARRALRVNLSDVAAMGATPRWYTLNLTLPEVDDYWLSAFSRGLFLDSELFGCHLVGGDTTRGPLSITITMIAEVPQDRAAITRGGARPGDHLLVTGTLGNAAVALDEGLLNEDAETHALTAAYWLPEPRIDFAIQSSPLVQAGCDISDGLVADVQHICEQSGVSACIYAFNLPLSPLVRRSKGERASYVGATRGDDYELALAVPQPNLNKVHALANQIGLKVTEVGFFKETEPSAVSSAMLLDRAGQVLVSGATGGYQHF